MDIYVLNPSFEEIGVIDVYNSFIWTTRYYDSGDFELYLPANAVSLDLLKLGNYISRDGDENTMVIEKIKITTDAENGNFIIASGRDLKSIFDRRVIFPQQNLSGSFEFNLYTMVAKICGSSAANYRYFPRLRTAALKGFPEKIRAQITGAVLYDYVKEVCQSFGYGWRINRNGNNLEFEIFKGENKPDVHFSPEFDSLLNSEYSVDLTKFKNYAIVAGEGEGESRTVADVTTGATGFDLREIYVDARDASTNDKAISSDEYTEILQQRGREKLAEAIITEDFTGSANAGIFTYKKDYNIGDIVTAENEYGIGASCRIVEVIESWSAKGYTILPTLEKWEVAE